MTVATTDLASRLAEGLGITRFDAKELLFPYVYGIGARDIDLSALVDSWIERANR